MAVKLSGREKREIKSRLEDISGELLYSLNTLETVAVDFAEATNRMRAALKDSERLSPDRRSAVLIPASMEYKGAESRYNQAGAYIKGLKDSYDKLYSELFEASRPGAQNRLSWQKSKVFTEYEKRRAHCKDLYMSRIAVDYTDEGAAQMTEEELNRLSGVADQTLGNGSEAQGANAEQSTSGNNQNPVQGQSESTEGAVQGSPASTAEGGAQGQGNNAPQSTQNGESTEGVQNNSQPQSTSGSPALAVDAGITRVNVAPVTIDIAPIVQRAVNATVERIERGLERKIESCIAGLDFSALTATAAGQGAQAGALAPAEMPAEAEAIVATARANTELSARLLEEEKAIYKQLCEMISSLGTLISDISTLANGCIELSAKQKELSELQRTVNDAQRTTMREQQGIQVNQRVIASDQATLNEEQAVIGAKNKDNIEAQRALVAEQETILGLQQSLAQSQSALNDAVKGAAEVQKQILQAQASIVQSNTKNLDGAKALAEKQEELSQMQKQTMTKQRAMIRETRAAQEKLQKGAKES